MPINNSPLLQGVRVLDLTHVVCGPYATRYLALLGADVIKIENPKTGGDMGRFTGPLTEECSIRFCSLNHNKRSVQLDLSKPEGREIFLRLAQKADVVVDNFRPGTTQKLGISFEDLQKVNPKIVCGSISGFGANGPYRDLPAYDTVAQAMSGVMFLSGEEGTPPVKIGTSIADMIAGLNLVIGVLAGLHKAERTGCGCCVETDLVGGLVSASMMEYVNYLYTGIAPSRIGNEYREWCPSGTYRARDGYFVLAIGRDSEFTRLARDVLGRTDLADDPAFATHPLRISNRGYVNQAINDWSKDKTVEQVCRLLRQANIPCAPVLDVPGVVSDPHIHDHRNMFPSYDQPKAGKVTVTNIPLKTPGAEEIPITPAPELGQHTREVLQELLGLDEEALKGLEQAGAIQEAISYA